MSAVARLPQVRLRLGLSLAGLLVLSACSLAPHYERPLLPVADDYPSYTTHAAPAAVVPVADLGWRTFFRDERLGALIALALENNRNLRVAIERVAEARAQFGIVESERLPTLGLGAQGQVTGQSDATRGNGDRVTRVFQAGVATTAFELDFFGRIRNLSEAARQQYLATEQAQRTVHLQLVAQVAEAYFRLRTAELLEDLMRKTLNTRTETMRLVQSRFDADVASELDLHQARTQLERVRADLAAIDRERSQAANALQLLVGAATPADLPAPAPFDREQLLAALPAGQPADLLTRRPDIIGAEHALMASNANIGAARAAFFPRVSLTGLLGFASPQLSNLFGSAAGGFWQFSPQIQIPIFSGGTAGNLALAEARRNMAVAQYEQSVQLAFREVADALAGEATYVPQLDALRAAEAAALDSLRLARLRYETGVDSFLQVQSAEENVYTVQQGFLQVGMASLLNRVALYKALGGGWLEYDASDEPTPVPATAVTQP